MPGLSNTMIWGTSGKLWLLEIQSKSASNGANFPTAITGRN